MTSNDIKKSASDAADQVQRSTYDLKSKASDAADDVSGKVSDLYGQAKDTLGQVSDRIPSATDALDTARKAYNGGSQQILRQVAKQPIEALLLAGAIGYLVGWAANRG